MQLRVEGPSTIAPGAPTQYRAVASFTDGSSEDVTTSASWTMASTSPLSLEDTLLVGQGGVVTGGSPGEADLVASLSAPGSGREDPQLGRLRVVVLSPGTFRLSGRVTEAETGAPLHAQVTILSGTGAGQRALAMETDGSYAVFGVAGRVTAQASEESFEPQTRTITVTDHHTLDFSLGPLSGYDAVTGDWRLTIRAAASCGSDIQENAATRTFQANLQQRGSAISLTITSPTTVTDTTIGPFGGIGPARVDFYLQKMPDETPPRFVLLDRLSTNQFLGIAGAGRGVRTGTRVEGTLSGEFSTYEAGGATYRAPGTILVRSCRRLTDSPVQTSETHSFVLERTD
jgi:hypothetical protein